MIRKIGTCCRRDLSASSQLTTLLKTCISLGTRRLSERSTAISVSVLNRFNVACVSACSTPAHTLSALSSGLMSHFSSVKDNRLLRRFKNACSATTVAAELRSSAK